MNKEEARVLAERIRNEFPNATATAIPDEDVPGGWESYHIDVCKQDVPRLCIRSVGQWEERRHLLKARGKQPIEQEWDIQAMLRGITKQLDQIVSGEVAASQEYMHWVVGRMDALIVLAGEETERQLRAIREEVIKAREKLREERTEGEFFPIAQNVLRLLREAIR
jgi:hypothetical protein